MSSDDRRRQCFTVRQSSSVFSLIFLHTPGESVKINIRILNTIQLKELLRVKIKAASFICQLKVISCVISSLIYTTCWGPAKVIAKKNDHKIICFGHFTKKLRGGYLYKTR